MKRTCLNLFSTTLILFLVFSGCVKDETEPEEPTPTTGTPVSTPGFGWTPGGGVATTADDFYYISAYSNIIGLKNGNGVDITLQELKTGTFSLSPSLGNTLYYTVGTTTYTGKSGTVNITTFAGNKISGNFSTTLTGGTVTSISGQFNDVPAK